MVSLLLKKVLSCLCLGFILFKHAEVFRMSDLFNSNPLLEVEEASVSFNDTLASSELLYGNQTVDKIQYEKYFAQNRKLNYTKRKMPVDFLGKLDQLNIGECKDNFILIDDFLLYYITQSVFGPSFLIIENEEMKIEVLKTNVAIESIEIYESVIRIKCATLVSGDYIEYKYYDLDLESEKLKESSYTAVKTNLYQSFVYRNQKFIEHTQFVDQKEEKAVCTIALGEAHENTVLLSNIDPDYYILNNKILFKKADDEHSIWECNLLTGQVQILYSCNSACKFIVKNGMLLIYGAKKIEIVDICGQKLLELNFTEIDLESRVQFDYCSNRFIVNIDGNLIEILDTGRFRKIATRFVYEFFLVQNDIYYVENTENEQGILERMYWKYMIDMGK